jgi:hypothetical protein
MEKLFFPIFITTLLVLFANIAPFIGVGLPIILALISIGPVATIWMAYRVLRDGTPSDKTFDQYWYEDSAR